jgi:hypothetical protein
MDGVVAAIVGIAFGVLATISSIAVRLIARVRNTDAWPLMRRVLPAIVLFGATSITLMGGLRVVHADPVALDHLAKVCAVGVPLAALYMVFVMKRR